MSKFFAALLIMSFFLHNNFDEQSSTKLFSDLYVAQLLCNISAKSFFRYFINFYLSFFFTTFFYLLRTAIKLRFTSRSVI